MRCAGVVMGAECASAEYKGNGLHGVREVRGDNSILAGRDTGITARGELPYRAEHGAVLGICNVCPATSDDTGAVRELSTEVDRGEVHMGTGIQWRGTVAWMMY